MKNVIFNSLRYISIIIFLLLASQNRTIANTVSTQVTSEIKFEAGIWQTIVDGQSGEGALFYRFKFDKNGTVEITKQFGGSDDIIEVKSWHQEKNKIIINSNKDAKITEFNGATLHIIDKNTLEYNIDNYKSIVKPHKYKLALLHWVLILVVLILLNETFRRSKWATIIFFVVLPLILTPLVWSQHGVTYWFKWAKIYSVIFAVIWFTLIRFTKIGKYNWVKMIVALFLAVNIAEAVTQDFSMGYLPNILNGIAGILSIVTLFLGWKKIEPDNSKQKDMVWPGMAIFWIIAYDIWNIVYVYLNFPGSTSAQFMVILSCTIPALFIKKGTWLQARAFTLAAWFMYYFTVPRFTEQMELMVPRSYNLMLIFATISIVANILYFFVFLKMIRIKFRNN
ncbi:MAG: DUF5692 family protein [Bacteroidales bacterium]|jgi:hypothetical protein|nr:DUF5692 family protein [Bacteroidales bacterium]